MNTIKVHCNSCNRDTDHNIVKEHLVIYEDKKYNTDWGDRYQIISCLGCKTVSFRQDSWYSEALDEGDGDDGVASGTFYPPRNINEHERMLEYHLLPQDLKRIYCETVDALNNRLPTISAIGLRTIVEAICLEQKTKMPNKNDLEEGIYGLADKEYLSKKQADILHKCRLMGNDAAHEIVAPDTDHLDAAIEIVEILLKAIYVIPTLAERIPNRSNNNNNNNNNNNKKRNRNRNRNRKKNRNNNPIS
ncbi:MAG: DUF4145 domain-containing protein [Planctomycetaceae bacterium]|jgi:hypothetical protein|nr:DUF4145 domain-containing protein [Planctomycetaceae bacterium]